MITVAFFNFFIYKYTNLSQNKLTFRKQKKKTKQETCPQENTIFILNVLKSRHE